MAITYIGKINQVMLDEIVKCKCLRLSNVDGCSI